MQTRPRTDALIAPYIAPHLCRASNDEAWLRGIDAFLAVGWSLRSEWYEWKIDGSCRRRLL